MNSELKTKIVDAILTPFAKAYGGGVWVRNKLFDIGVLKEETFDTPVISVGNITVGGTGKTPHVEYIVELLCQEYNIGVLSRGYKRATSGFVLANEGLSPRDLGDEPYQIYRKFRKSITLAVCEKRAEGIRKMLEINPDINLFVLDDAYQHRYVKPKVNIVLCDFYNPPYNDQMMPLGRLREPINSLERADLVVLTKCPQEVNPIDFRIAKNGLKLFPSQGLFYSSYMYANIVPVFPVMNPEIETLNDLTEQDTIIALTGVARHLSFVKYLRRYPAKVKVIRYGDHHEYSRKDFEEIFDYYDSLSARRKYIVTTEKDAVRILNSPYFPPEMRHVIYYVPIKVRFLNTVDGKVFIDYVRNLILKK